MPEAPNFLKHSMAFLLLGMLRERMKLVPNKILYPLSFGHKTAGKSLMAIACVYCNTSSSHSAIVNIFVF